MTPGSIVYYTYDGYGRLSMEEDYDLNEDYIYDRRYYYNSRGNRTREYKDYDQYHYSYNNANNKLTSYYDDNELVTFSYYDNGNLTLKVIRDYITLAETGRITYEYDNFNRLISYTEGNNTTTYSYYADNLRASKTDSSNNTTSFIWNGQNLAYECTGTDAKYYSYDITGIAAVKTGGEQKIYAKNPHNDIVGQVNGSGVLSGAKDFNSFGELVSCTSVSGFGYAGEYHDTESGYIYLRNRYYDPDIGRFITEDPAKDGTNWYVYCGNNPVMFWDPLGLKNRSLRDLVNETTGNIVWNSQTKIATVTIDGVSKNYKLNEQTVENNKIYVDDEQFYNDFSLSGKITIFSYWDRNEEGNNYSSESLTGHSFIHYESFDGIFDTYYSTWQWGYDENGIVVKKPQIYYNRDADKELANNPNTSSYSKIITENQQTNMAKEILKPSNDTWSYNNTCATFAVKIFKAATGINFGYTVFPKTVKSRIDSYR